MNTTNTDPGVTALDAMNEGVDAADYEADPARKNEAADVLAWRRKINAALGFDADAHRNYVRCRRYARGDSGFIVDANIVGTNIDITEAFLYAKNPDVDIMPAKAVESPSGEALIDAAMWIAEQSEEVEQARQLATSSMVMAAQQAMATPGAPFDPVAVKAQLDETVKAVTDMVAAQSYAKLKAEYQRRMRENKAFAETSELVTSRLWQDGRLKDRGRPWVRSMVTIGPGIIKGAYQVRTEPAPETSTAINDAQQNLERVRALQKQALEVGTDSAEHDATIAELERQLDTLRQTPEQPVAKGFVVDNVAGENFVVAPGFRIADHMDAPWNAERIPMEFDEAVAKYRLDEHKKTAVTKYMARRPVIRRDESANYDGDNRDVDPREAMDFVQGDAFKGPDNLDRDAADGVQGAGHFVMVWEVWDRVANKVLTTIEGLTCWVKPAWVPPSTTRFYPYFVICASEVDNQRHPQSPVERCAKLVDEYNRIGSQEAKHRKRTIPKTAFNAGAFVAGEAEKLEKADVQEMVGLKLTNPNADIRTIILPITYAAIDVQLYDRSRIIGEIERIWGVQEALGGTIDVEKTATEAEIQQMGMQARMGSRRDTIEAVLTHFALYTLQVARRYLSDDEVREIAGPNAFWPPYKGAEDVRTLLNVDIRAGTTGKPNSRADREAWGVLLPQLQGAIIQYASLVQSRPQDLAESIKKLAAITAERAGDRIDVESLFPPPGMPTIDPATGQPTQPGAAPNGSPGGQPGGAPNAGGPAGAPAPDPVQELAAASGGVAAPEPAVA